jgi:hypothetical protein
VLIRVGFGLVSLILSAVMVKSAMARLIQGAATMFAAAAAFAIGFSLVAGTLFSAIRRRRARRTTP